MAAGCRTQVRACPGPACVQAQTTTPHPCSPPGLGVPPHHHHHPLWDMEGVEDGKGGAQVPLSFHRRKS